MPGIFRNSPVDSLTSAVNSLHERQRSAQQGQMQMMELESNLQEREAERKLLPERLALEEKRLDYEVKMGEMGMDIEVAKAGMQIVTQQLNNMTQLDQFIFDKSMRPFDVVKKRLENRMLAANAAYLPVELRLRTLQLEQMNNVNGIVALSTALDLNLNSMVKSVMATRDAVATQTIAAQWLKDKSYTTTGHSRIPVFINKGQEQLFKSARKGNPEITEESFISDSMLDIGEAMERIGDFVNEKGEWVNRPDEVFGEVLKQATEEIYSDKLINLARTNKKYMDSINRIDEIDNLSVEDSNENTDKEKERLRKEILNSIEYDGKQFQFRDYNSVGGGNASTMIWDSVYNDTEAIINFKTYMMANAEISKQNYISSTQIGLVDLISQKTRNIASGKTSEAGQALIGEAENNFNLISEEFLNAIGNSGWQNEEDTKALKSMILRNPKQFGVTDLDGDDDIAEYFYGSPTFNR